MFKNIWIFNHYIVPPSIEVGHRHNKFAKYLVKDGYNVSLFLSSALHNTDKNLINDDRKYLIEDSDQGRYIAIKTRNYKGSVLKRLFNILDYFCGLFKTTKKVENVCGKPDIIIASSVHPFTCVAGIMIAKKYKTKCIVEIRDLWPLSLIVTGSISRNGIISKFLYWLECWIYKKADSIIFTMEGGKDYIRDRGWSKKIDLNKIYYINNGIDLSTFIEQRENNIYNDYHLDNKSLYKIIYTGAIRPANDIMRLVKLAELLNDTEYKDKIVILVFGDGIERELLEKYSNELGLTNIIFKGPVKKDYIPNILSKANLTFLNYNGNAEEISCYGGSHNKLFDYLAAEKPIISNISESYSIIKEFNCGEEIVSSVEDVLKKVIEFYNMDNENYKIICENAKEAAKRFNFLYLTKTLEEVIDKTINNTRIRGDIL